MPCATQGFKIHSAMTTNHHIPQEVWIKVILFVEDTDLPQLAKTSTLLQNLTRDIIVRKKLRQRVSQRLDRALFRIPQRCTRIQLARLNVLRGPPGLHRRLNQGEYLGATVATYNAIHERNREDLRRHLNRALQKRPSNDDFILIQVTAGSCKDFSPVLVARRKQLEKAMKSDLIQRNLRQKHQLPAVAA